MNGIIVSGRSRITVECRGDGSSVASELYASYPCRLHLISSKNNTNTVPRNNPSRALSCYVLGYGGGLISGDNIQIDIHVRPKATLLITSQSTSKAFKHVSGREDTFVQTRAAIGSGALLCLVPQPIQCFSGSRLSQETNIFLDGNYKVPEDEPSVMMVDWYTGGRKYEEGGVWQLDAFHTTTKIFCSNGNLHTCKSNADVDSAIAESKNNLIFRDSTKLSGGRELFRHMRGFNIIGMVLFMGPRTEQISSKLMKLYSSRTSFVDCQHDNDMNITNSFNSGVGLNKQNEGLIVSCGPFSAEGNGTVCKGTILRFAACTLEVAGTFLSQNIGDMGELETDPFMEILISKQGRPGPIGRDEKYISKNEDIINSKNTLRFQLLQKSYHSSQMRSNNLSSSLKVNPILLFQMIDSCVPSGAFAHSNTLETAHQLQLIQRDDKSSWTKSLREHILDVILQTYTSTVPFLVASCSLFQVATDSDETSLKETINAWKKLDSDLRCNMTSHVASRASTTQGSGILRAYASAFPHIAPIIKRIKKVTLLVDPVLADFSGHSATCFGAVCGMLCIDEETCASMFLYTTARDMVNAAVRMNLIGPLEGMQVTSELCHFIAELLKNQVLPLQNGSLNYSNSHQVCPIVELLANVHDRLYTRLFNS